MSPQSKLKRERYLEKMRYRWTREKRKVKRGNGKTEYLKLVDLARACRVAKGCVTNEALKAHLEIAATYFEDANDLRVVPETRQ